MLARLTEPDRLDLDFALELFVCDLKIIFLASWPVDREILESNSKETRTKTKICGRFSILSGGSLIKSRDVLNFGVGFQGV